MKAWLRKLPGILLALVLSGFLIWVVWQPIIPSVWIIKKMADSIDPSHVHRDLPVLVRFDLSGKGGGVYNIVVHEDRVETVEGNSERADLILFMNAADFNALMFSLARGTADEYTFQSLIISKGLRFAGDIRVFEELFEKKDRKGDNP